MDILATLAPIVTNLLIVCAFSMFLWKKSILSDIAEQTFIATSIALSLTAAVGQIRAAGITPLMQGNFIVLLPIALGLFIYAQFIRKYAFLQKWSVAFVVGVGLAIVVVTSVQTSILQNLIAAIAPVGGVSLTTALNDLLMIIATFTTTIYFLFTRRRVGILGKTQRLGRYLMMVYFGGSFGAFVFTRLALFIGTLNQFIINLKTIFGLG